ncbi:MAG: hypothetical protein JKY48_11490 [Flavobacteriales bacterium]|nr:hypothetical protein [Flavobacteriales bacterium]
MSLKKEKQPYFIQFLIDYGPPTALSIMWAAFAAYQEVEKNFWDVFTKNFVPAFFVLNWIAMRIHRTKRAVDGKKKSKVTREKLDQLDEKLDRIEKLLLKNQEKK